jgi:hypothetical protein
VPPTPINLLLILGSAAVAIVYGTHGPVHVLIVVGFAAAAVAVIIQAAPPEGAPIVPDKIDERDTEHVLTIGAYFGVLTVGAIALLVAFVWPFGSLALLAVAAVWVVAWWPRLLRTASLTTSIWIERDPATVFSFVSNLENEPKFWPVVERIEKLTPGPIGPGTQFSARATLPASHGIGPQIFEGIEQIIEYEPDRRFTSSVTSGIHANFDEVTFDPVDNGTLVTHHFQFVFSYSTAVIGSILIFGGTANRELMTNRTVGWARAKEILESDGQAT